ncbi:hypothetical protein B0H66DRAFT_540579 [Apodospora peruviana]|uniref:Uncharacterized protein n=1 Tax=Apodospora peruviana TaxID=516989 RepID=A0AAE0IQD3_9PEZI|nr:hypothetical protein B0H66DRAFT_540579 [Apodospora peruviana]
MTELATISDAAWTAAVDIDALIKDAANTQNGSNDGAIIKKFTILAIRLQQFRNHTDQLGDWIADGASALSPRLQAVLDNTIAECAKVSAVVFGEIGRVTGGGRHSLEAIDPNALAEYNALLAAYSRVCIFVTQVYALGHEGEQESKLDHPDVQQLLRNAQATTERVMSSKGILLSDANPRLVNGN